MNTQTTIKLKRLSSGNYEFAFGRHTFSIAKNNESGMDGQWMIRQSDDLYSYSDPIPTLRDCRDALSYMITHPTEYGL